MKGNEIDEKDEKMKRRWKSVKKETKRLRWQESGGKIGGASSLSG